MKGIATLIRVDGTIIDTTLTEKVTLEHLKLAVGGHIEHVPMFDLYMNEHCIAFCNEEGKLLNLPFNMVATTLWRAQRVPHPIDDVLNGDVIIIRGDNELMEAL
jgi:hypothetical protein